MSFAIRTSLTRTLRGQLALWQLAILTAAMSAFAAMCYAVLSWNLYGHHDDELAHQAEGLVRALDVTPLTQIDIHQALAGTPVGTRFIMIRNARGELLYQDPVLASSEPQIGQQEVLVHAATIAPRSPEFFTVDLERSAEVRFICVPLRQSGAYLQIGDPLGDVRSVLRSIALACLPLFPAVLFLSSFGGWVIAKRALAPVRSVTATMREIQAADLSRRIETHPTDQELGALVGTLNQLLDRLQQAFESLRQFAGDVSHEIHTPLTVIKGALDGARRDPEQARDPAWLRSVADEVEGIRTIVVDLRALALADAPIPALAPVNLTEIVEEAADIVAALGELRDVTVRCSAERALTVRGDATRLKQIVLNLGDNAVKYTPAGGQVTIRLEAVGARAVLRVSDTGIGIPAEHLPRLFDRLFRVEAGDGTADGTGLGLAIVKRIVDVHGGTATVQSTPGAGSTFTVEFPRLG